MSSGPVVLIDGVEVDAPIWENDMNPDAEDEYDRMLNLDALHEILGNELKRRAAPPSTDDELHNNFSADEVKQLLDLAK
jgi:hypothetical protein